MIRAIVAFITRRPRPSGPVMHLPQSQVPGVIRESARCVFKAHGMWVVDRKGVLITDERYEQLLREIGNNCVQGLYSVDQNPENA